MEKVTLERVNRLRASRFLRLEIKIGKLVTYCTSTYLAFEQPHKRLRFSWSKLFTMLLRNEKTPMRRTRHSRYCLERLPSRNNAISQSKCSVASLRKSGTRHDKRIWIESDILSALSLVLPLMPWMEWRIP